MTPLLLQALRGEPLARPPVWLMRQAGRYMAEYRALKERHSFLELCKSPELAHEVTMQPIHFLDPDAAIVFADILLPAEGLGLDIDFAPGPIVKNPLRSNHDIAALKHFPVETKLSYVFQTIRTLAGTLRSNHPGCALLGFAGAPWTMGCYLIDQGPFKHFLGTQVFASRYPAAMHSFLSMLADLTADYLEAQFEAGADAVQLFDSWGGNLNLDDYRRFSFEPTKRIVDRLQQKGCPIILYVNGGSHLLPAISEIGATALSVDWRVRLDELDTALGSRCCIQGNLDPTHLFLSGDEVEQRTKDMLRSLKRRSHYIANLGHGILPTTPPENVLRFVKTVQAGWPE